MYGAVVLVTVGLVTTAASAASLLVTTRPLDDYESCTLLGHSSSVVADAHVSQEFPSTNFGTSATLTARAASNKVQRVLIRFDLSACDPHIPASASITAARLRLYMTGVPNGNPTFSVHRITSCPEALAGCWGESSTTWTNQPSVNATATASVGKSGGGAQWMAWGVGTDVSLFRAGTAPNNGWMIQTTSDADATWRSRETTASAEAPQLVVIYRR